MPVNKKYLANFEYGEIYHVYNRTNNRELLFRSPENYLYFLRQFDRYLSPVVDTFAWNLLPNHFHFLIRIKPASEVEENIAAITCDKQSKTEKQYFVGKQPNTLVEKAFTRFFTSYAMAFNKMYKRKGNLFSRTFKRISIVKDSHFTQVLIYIHANAQKHQLVKDFVSYPWSSYHTMLTDEPTTLLREEVLDWFGGATQFILVHRTISDYYYNCNCAIEEDDAF